MREWLNRGVQAFKAADYPQAAAAFQRAVDSDPSNVTARLYLGTAWMQQWVPGVDGKDNQLLVASAEKEFRRVMELDPGNRTALGYLASLKLNQKQWDEAEILYRSLAASDRRDTMPWYSLGWIAWAQWYPAEMGARARLAMKPADPPPMPAGAIKELKVQYLATIEKGLDALRHALEIDPQYDDAMAYMNLLTRERADLRDTPEEVAADTKAADEWLDKAMAIKRAKAAKSAPGGDR